MNKRININDFYREIILNDEIMVSLESASLIHYPNNLLLSFLSSEKEVSKNIPEEPLAEIYLDKKSLFKLLDFLAEFKQKMEVENE